ncbi:exosortase A [Noviherbaspirillum galbum]|uniref:Exosortase A n=1 Tax=Noviherbaspirillum galbum TaxID=2709383 RepID=A0A6B3SZJ8_9BURK|nr:exosortase A [Noviherbaspirillum galbum]NEX64179.1 exosortase A [Noviherbaspirillum galbum]
MSAILDQVGTADAGKRQLSGLGQAASTVSTASTTAPPSGARALFWLCLSLIGGILLAYAGTIAGMASIWFKSDTFLHGILIAPISLWLVWSRRRELSRLQPKPQPLGLAALCFLGFAWLLATLADVQVVRHFAVVAMIPAAIWTLLGKRMTATIGFPLAFLLLAVPFGDAFIPTLIDITANATVWALQLTGIPVFREGNAFSIPSGNWSVVEACSGVRYLIASLTLGSLYAYLTYRTLSRRLMFIAISILLPIAANSVRAYMIVMIGHLSGMTLAVGVDHLIYGWIFFGVVMALLFWTGTIWREDHETPQAAGPANADAAPGTQPLPAPRIDLKPVGRIAALCIAVLLIWPAWAKFIASPSPDTPATLDFPAFLKRWQQPGQASPWSPQYTGNPMTAKASFRFSGKAASIHVAHYPVQADGVGLVTFGNTLVAQDDPNWHASTDTRRLAVSGNTAMRVRESVVFGPGVKLLVWRWYVMDGTTYANPYVFKAALALQRLLGRSTAASEIMLYAPLQERREDAEASLAAFLPDAALLMRERSGHANQR